jgi:hypothetical protein
MTSPGTRDAEIIFMVEGGLIYLDKPKNGAMAWY